MGNVSSFYPHDSHACELRTLLTDVAQVAGMQEQLRAIENTNENLIEDQQRWRSQLLGSQAPADSDTQACSEDVESLQA